VNIKLIFSVEKGFLTQRVSEIPVKFVNVHAKKWGEKTVPDVIIKELDILRISL
jgi:hypothetical protein